MVERANPVDVALEYVLSGDRLHGVRAFRIGEERAAVLALRANSLLEYVCAVNVDLAKSERQRADALAVEAERRRPSGRRVNSVAESQRLREDAARRLAIAEDAESAALLAIGESDLSAARRAVAHMSEAKTGSGSDSAEQEWPNALEVTERLRKWQRKRLRWQFVRGRAEQGVRLSGGALSLSLFDQYRLGGASLTRRILSGSPGTIGSAVELLGRWDLGEDPRASVGNKAAALEAIRAVRRGEHTESGTGRVAAMFRTSEFDDLDELEWLEGENDETLEHIAEMRARIARCFERFGRPDRPGTWAVHSERFQLDGHIDFVTPDTIWDLKVSATAPDRVDILQLLLYWITFCDDPANSREIAYLGIYNPRVDLVWRIATTKIPRDVLVAVESLALSEP